MVQNYVQISHWELNAGENNVDLPSFLSEAKYLASCVCALIINDHCMTMKIIAHYQGSLNCKIHNGDITKIYKFCSK